MCSQHCGISQWGSLKSALYVNQARLGHHQPNTLRGGNRAVQAESTNPSSNVFQRRQCRFASRRTVYAFRMVHSINPLSSQDRRKIKLETSLSNLKTEPQHTALVLLYCRLAILLRVRRFGKQHAIIAFRLLFLANTAGLYPPVSQFVEYTLGEPSPHTFGLEAASALWETAGVGAATCPREAICTGINQHLRLQFPILRKQLTN